MKRSDQQVMPRWTEWPIWIGAALVGASITLPARAQSETTFTYQGELRDSGGLANGPFNMKFSLWSAASGGIRIGQTQTLNAVSVADGRFSVALDFGAPSFTNASRWLEIGVNGFLLDPRTRITRSPYSIQTRGIYVDNQNRIGIGTTVPEVNSRITVNANGYQEAIRASSGATGSATIHGSNGNVLGEVIRADGIADVTSTGGGVIVVGQDNDYNLGIDRNEIMARFNGAPSDLFLNLEGGNTEVGGRLGVGVNPGFAQLRVHDTDPGAAFGLEVETTQQTGFPSILATNVAGGPALWAHSDSDVALSGGGAIVVGQENSLNLAIDRNEIMARNNGQPSPLHINLEGGDVFMGAYAIKPAFAYGHIDADATIVSVSSNVTAVTRTAEGIYRIEVAGNARSTDIIVATARDWYVSARISGAHYEVHTITSGDDLFDREFNFIVYRP